MAKNHVPEAVEGRTRTVRLGIAKVPWQPGQPFGGVLFDSYGVQSDTHLRALIVSSGRDSVLSRLPVEALFVCIGGVPRTEGAAEVGLALDGSGYVRTETEVSAAAGALDGWRLSRQPLPLETNLPGLFAAGDVRSGSIKRCAAAIGEGSMAVALVHQRLAEVGSE